MFISFAILYFLPLQGNWSYICGYNINVEGTLQFYLLNDHSLCIEGCKASIISQGMKYEGIVSVIACKNKTLAIDIEFTSGANSLVMRSIFISNGKLAILRFADSDVSARPTRDILSSQKSITTYLFIRR